MLIRTGLLMRARFVCVYVCVEIPADTLKPRNRHPSESWKRISTAEWLVIHFDFALSRPASTKIKIKMDPSFRWDDVSFFCFYRPWLIT